MLAAVRVTRKRHRGGTGFSTRAGSHRRRGVGRDLLEEVLRTVAGVDAGGWRMLASKIQV
ncbi:hypothetical protein ACNKHU_21450 [Shigella flexneri]